jgi:hypothetical protein
MAPRYNLRAQEEDPAILAKYERMWTAELRLIQAARDHDGSERTYLELDRAATAFVTARFLLNLAIYDKAPSA